MPRTLPDHIRDDENQQHIDGVHQDFVRCGLWIDDDQRTRYSTPSNRVITDRTAKNRINKRKDKSICKRCKKSLLA